MIFDKTHQKPKNKPLDTLHWPVQFTFWVTIFLNSNERRGALLGAALIFSAIALLRRLFGCGAHLDAALI